MYTPIISSHPHIPHGLYLTQSMKEPIPASTEDIKDSHRSSVGDIIHATKLLWNLVPLGRDRPLSPKPEAPSGIGQQSA